MSNPMRVPVQRCWQPRPPCGIAEIIVDESSTQLKEVRPLKSLQEQLGLRFCSLVVSAKTASLGLCANLCPEARGPLDPPTCQLEHLSIAAGHETTLRQACEFLSRTTFPHLETLRLAYTGRTSAALESRLPTLGLQKCRLPRLKLCHGDDPRSNRTGLHGRSGLRVPGQALTLWRTVRRFFITLFF
eukprot:g68551.t1